MLPPPRRTGLTIAILRQKAGRVCSAMLSDGGISSEQRRTRQAATRVGAAMFLLLCIGAMINWQPWSTADAGIKLGLRRDPAAAAAAVGELDRASISADGSESDVAPFSSLTHLVLVAGHAVLTSTDVHDVSSPSNWLLLDYQRDQLRTFVAHIRRGVEIATADTQALLVFSGGETRVKAGPRSEAQSYWTAAEHEGWWKPPAETGSELVSASPAVRPETALPDDVSSRAVTEEYARDSFENLFFSVCRFREVTGAYPARITVVGFAFKAERFRTLHRAALRYPEERFAYEGIDPPMSSDAATDPVAAAAAAQARAAMLSGEQSASYLPFQRDPYSCYPPLSLKKRARNPFRRSHRGYEHTCPELRPLLRFCARTVFDGPLPWDSDDKAIPSTQTTAEQQA